MLELKRDEIIGSWRKMLNEELHNSYSSSSYKYDQVNEGAMHGSCSTYEWKTNAYRVLTGSLQRKRNT
jgi:hypothetical protein